MSHLTPATPAPQPSLTQLIRTLEAMCEAGWLTNAPTPPSVDATRTRIPATELPEECR
jgi:hypothetical protein